MNLDFQARHGQALALLSLLSKEAEKRGQLLVFLGGSAVQATLSNPRRLSVDLDVYYDGDAKELLRVLEPEYELEARPTLPTELFDFYKASKDRVLVKIDVARFHLVADGGTPYEQKELDAAGSRFKTFIATSDYLLASKLVNTAVGATGRAQFNPTDFLKDVFDANCLADEFGTNLSTWHCFGQINEVQNEIRKTSFTLGQTIQAARNNLINCVPTTQPLGTVPAGALKGFEEYLLRGGLSQLQLSEMAYRMAAYLKAFEQKEEQGAPRAIREIESTVQTRFNDAVYADQCIRGLIPHGIPVARLQQLKLVRPKALLYLDAAYNSHF